MAFDLDMGFLRALNLDGYPGPAIELDRDFLRLLILIGVLIRPLTLKGIRIRPLNLILFLALL